MTVGEDIKEALEDIGPTIIIIRDSGNIDEDEYVDYDTNSQVTKPFIREFFLEAMVSYDTDLIPGDVFEIGIIDERYLFMNKTPVIIEGAVAYYDSVFYKCNVSGELLRPSETRSSQTYQKASIFSGERPVAYGLLTEPLFSGDLETEEQLGLIGIHKEELYIPSSYGIQVLDRYQPVSGEYYVVESIKPRRFSGIDVAILGEDNR